MVERAEWSKRLSGAWCMLLLRSLTPLVVVVLPGCGGGGSPAATAPPPPPPPPGQTVLVDEAHNNFHTLRTTLGPLAALLRREGYTAVASGTSFSRSQLDRGKVLVISNALHARNAGGDWSLPTPSAFTEDEIVAVRSWVGDGGSLLLIADHMPFPGAAEELAAAFGVTFNNGFAFDTMQLARPSTCLRPEEIQIFRRSDGTLMDHPITSGRSEAERVDSVATFTGQAFEPDGVTESLLVFAPHAVSWMPAVAWQFPEETSKVGVEGWRQGAVREFGAGRIAFFGEAAMFTEQTCGGGFPMGMNAPAAAQHGQLILNLFRWLSGEP